MTSSGSDELNFQHESTAELLALADLAGIKGPGDTIRIFIELVSMGMPAREVHQLLRDILAHKSRTKRASASRTSQNLSQPSSSAAAQNPSLS